MWVIEVTKHSYPRHTGCHTCWFLALLNKFDAEPAFFDIALFFDDPDIIRTSGDAILTTDALVFVY
jgi:hypothetical protein